MVLVGEKSGYLSIEFYNFDMLILLRFVSSFKKKMLHLNVLVTLVYWDL